MKKIILLIGLYTLLVVISGCTKEIDCTRIPTKDSAEKFADECLQSINISFITEEYTGDLFYCFFDKYYNKSVCLPYTDNVRVNVIEYDNITNYSIVNISK